MDAQEWRNLLVFLEREEVLALDKKGTRKMEKRAIGRVLRG